MSQLSRGLSISPRDAEEITLAQVFNLLEEDKIKTFATMEDYQAWTQSQ